MSRTFNLGMGKGFVLTGFVLGLSSCSSEVLTVEETDQVLTIKSPVTDYASLRTYSLPDEVLDLCQLSSDEDPSGMGGSSLSPEDCREVSHQWDDVAIAAIRSNMENLGYREVDESTDEMPDVAFMMGWVARDNWYVSTYYPYCYPSGYYYYGCWYGSRSYSYNLPTGSLLVDMVVVDESQANDFESGWTMAFQGLLATSSTVGTQRRIERAINQGFSQSPYLSEGGAK